MLWRGPYEASWPFSIPREPPRLCISGCTLWQPL